MRAQASERSGGAGSPDTAAVDDEGEGTEPLVTYDLSGQPTRYPPDDTPLEGPPDVIAECTRDVSSPRRHDVTSERHPVDSRSECLDEVRSDVPDVVTSECVHVEARSECLHAEGPDDAVGATPPRWEHNFPTRAEVLAPAGLFLTPSRYQALLQATEDPVASRGVRLARVSRPVEQSEAHEGSSPMLQWSPATVRILTVDLARAEHAAERALKQRQADVKAEASDYDRRLHLDRTVASLRDDLDSCVVDVKAVSLLAAQAWQRQKELRRQRARETRRRKETWRTFEVVTAVEPTTFRVDVGMGQYVEADSHTDARADHGLAQMAEQWFADLAAEQLELRRRLVARRSDFEEEVVQFTQYYREAVRERATHLAQVEKEERRKVPAASGAGTKAAITGFSAKSKNGMCKGLASLDYSPMFQGVLTPPGMLTLTYPDTWEVVVPSKAHFKGHIKALRMSIERNWNVMLYALWKLEFQGRGHVGRGAPHVHIYMMIPTGLVDGMNFSYWVRLEWARIVAHPDPVERAQHLVHGAYVSYPDGMRADDPKRLAMYYLKHGTFASKDYQHNVPDLWMQNGGPGRFWGKWRLKPLTVTVPLDPISEWVRSARIIRGVGRSFRYNPRRENAIPVRTLRVPRVDTTTGVVRYRKVTRRRSYMTGIRGYLIVNDGPRIVTQLHRALHPADGPTAEALVQMTPERRHAVLTTAQPTARAALYRALREAPPDQRHDLRARLADTPSSSYAGRLALIDLPSSSPSYKR